MATVRLPREQRLVLYGVDWRTYGRLLRDFGDRPAVHLTYDRGCLEISTFSHEHETIAHLLGRYVDALTEELGLPVKGGRSTTFRRRRKKRGLEPDECYWIANEHLVRNKDKINLRTDPPPDLVLEVDITHSSIDRLAIYAVLGVPEVWRWKDKKLVCYVLDQHGRHAESRLSKAFPHLAPADIASFLAKRGQMDENALVRQFRAWVRQQTPP
jgi:Uma2 family endonuclease